MFFKYNVDATLEGIITASEISGGDIISLIKKQ